MEKLYNVPAHREYCSWQILTCGSRRAQVSINMSRDAGRDLHHEIFCGWGKQTATINRFKLWTGQFNSFKLRKQQTWIASTTRSPLKPLGVQHTSAEVRKDKAEDYVWCRLFEEAW